MANSRIRNPIYIFLNPVYVAARSLRSNYLKLLIKVLEADIDANVLFLVRVIVIIIIIIIIILIIIIIIIIMSSVYIETVTL